MPIDIEYINDNNTPNWLNKGNLQGVVFNGVNQYAAFTSDLAFQNTINQNNIFTIEISVKGKFCLTNKQSLFAPNTHIFYEVNDTLANCLGLISPVSLIFDRRTTAASFAVSNYVPNRSKLSHAIMGYDGNKNSNTSFLGGINGTIFKSERATGNPDTLVGDNVYTSPIINLGISYNTLNFISGVIRDLRIYTAMPTIKQIRDKYNNLPSPIMSNPFCEWKMRDISDFYVYSGNLYARNTGSSGNGLDNGTGYDFQFIGYPSNIPIFNTLL